MTNSINWNDIKSILVSDLKIIFKDYDINSLSDYEKRRIIFEYLASDNHITYDYDKLELIRNIKNKLTTNTYRNTRDELIDTIYNKKGICNSISQYYKLLLELVGIDSYCIVCDDGTDINHQLNIVYDKENDTYSFDDITSVIVNRGTINEFFDYDINDANMHSQGLKPTEADETWVVIPNELIYYYVSKEDNSTYDLSEFPIDRIFKSGKSIKR